MRPLARLVFVIALTLLASGERARAESVTFGTDYQPNVVSLWSSVPFQLPAANAFGNGWGVAVFDPTQPNFIQLQRPAGYGVLNPTPPQPGWLTYTQPFAGTVTTNPAFALDWQEVYFNTATNTFVQGFAGRVQSNGAGLVNGTYASTPGLGPTTAGGAPLFIGPTPEPSSMIAFGIGLAVVGAARRRRRAARAA